jgi:RNA polymerase sigma-70 factor (ECF subfamily)
MAVPTTFEAVQVQAARAPTHTRFEFAEVYDAHVDFVYRSVRRLGVDASSVDDVVQELFLVVHRRLPEFEGRSSIKTWVFGIALRVVRDHRRTIRRKRLGADARADSTELDRLADEGLAPFEALARAEAAKVLEGLLDSLDDEKREVFVLAELEGMSVPEISEITGVNTNTIHSRLRVARRTFEEGIARLRARMAFREGKR